MSNIPMGEQTIEKLSDLRAYIESIISGDPAEAAQALDHPAALAGVTPDQYTTVLQQVLTDHGVPAEAQGHIIDQLHADADYSPQGLIQNLNIVVNDSDVTNNVDQSVHVDGEVHGDVVQEGNSNVANATAEGAIAGDHVSGNQVQTGDGQQVGHDSGVQNQGDNSGQLAGHDATADNVTSGDNNTVASDEASRVGADQVSQDHASLDDSAQAFGHGSVDNTANDSYDSHDSYSESATATDSFNTHADYNDNDTNTQHLNYEEDDHSIPTGHEYEPSVDHEDYKSDDHHDSYEHESSDHDGYDHDGGFEHQAADIIDSH
jgi:hypothetical protein